MANFYHKDYKDLDLEHLLYLSDVIQQIKIEVISIPPEYFEEEDVKVYLEDRLVWLEKLQVELDLLHGCVIH